MILGAIASIGMIASQVYWLSSTWNLNEREFEQKVGYALHNVAKSLAKENKAELPSRNIVNRRLSNYYVVNIEYEINPGILEHYLLTEFEKLALYLDFEYAVYDCTSDEMVYGKYIKFSPNSTLDIKKSELPKSKEFTYYFGVKFPNHPTYLLQKMQLSVIFAVFLLITIVFFAFAMYTILKQKRLSEMQKDFINNMTHEFKTPISTIGISADVFIKSPVVKSDQRLSQYAAILKEQNQRLNNQVEKILQLAKIERDGLKLKKEDFDIIPIVKTVVHSVALRLDEFNGEIQFLEPDASPLVVKADKLHFTNTLHNLLDNAIKYCNTKPKIEVKIEKKFRQILLSIQDNGIGIKKDDLSKVFDKFYRIPTGNIHNVKGFGLGLFYVKEVANAHGWQVQVESEEGKGTKVILKISCY